MALLSLSAPPSVHAQRFHPTYPFIYRGCTPIPNPKPICSTSRKEFLVLSPFSSTICPSRKRRGRLRCVVSHLCEQETLTLDGRSLSVKETLSEEELWAAVRLRVRTFYEFNQSYGLEDHKRYLTEREYEALKDRIAGKRIGFQRVSCINATLPLSPSLVSADELCSACKFPEDGEDRVVVGTLDLNQCVRMADELAGKRPEGVGDDLTRAYLSNVCVAKELQRNGLGYALVAKSKKVARKWGITDLYVHVAVDNEAAQKLYKKSGFVYENEEPAWKARFLGRPRRLLFWTDTRQANL